MSYPTRGVLSFYDQNLKSSEPFCNVYSIRLPANYALKKDSAKSCLQKIENWDHPTGSPLGKI